MANDEIELGKYAVIKMDNLGSLTQARHYRTLNEALAEKRRLASTGDTLWSVAELLDERTWIVRLLIWLERQLEKLN